MMDRHRNSVVLVLVRAASRQCWRLLLGCLLTGLLFGAIGYSTHERDQATVPEGLSVHADDLDFGTQWEQREFQWDFQICNRSDSDVQITGWRRSCRCTSVEPRSLTVPLHGTAQARLTINLSRKTTADSNMPEREFSTDVMPIISESHEQYTWRFRGRVRHAFREIPSLHVGEITTDGTDTNRYPFEITTYYPLRDVSADCDEGHGTVEIEPVGWDGQRFRAIVSVSREIPLGLFQFDLFLHATDETGGRLPPMRIPVSGRVASDVYALPEAMTFGNLRIGEPARQRVTFRSRSEREFRLVESTIGLGEARLIEIEEQSRPTEHVFDLAITAATLGTRWGDATFEVQQEGVPNYTIPIHVSFTVYRAEEASNGGDETDQSAPQVD